MKTATVPNDTMTQQLMEVSAELTVAAEQFEKHIVTHAAERIIAAAQNTYADIVPLLGSIKADDLPQIKKLICYGILTAAKDANVFNKIQENARGFTGEFAPSVITNKAIDQANLALLDWWEVST